MLADFVDSADVRMIQRGSSASFAPKAFERLGILGNILRKELQRYESAEFEIFGLGNDAHAAPAKNFDNLVVRDGLTNHVR